MVDQARIQLPCVMPCTTIIWNILYCNKSEYMCMWSHDTWHVVTWYMACGHMIRGMWSHDTWHVVKYSFISSGYSFLLAALPILNPLAAWWWWPQPCCPGIAGDSSAMLDPDSLVHLLHRLPRAYGIQAGGQMIHVVLHCGCKSRNCNDISI